MKILAIVVDGRGHVRVAATRSPDLWRRQVSQETGRAELVLVALAPPGLAPTALLDRIDHRFWRCRIEDGRYEVDEKEVVRFVTRLIRWYPLAMTLTRRLAKAANRLLHPVGCRLRIQ